jgi:hypothetical protein
MPAREAPVAGADYAQPAVFLDYAQPAVFLAEVDEVPPGERHVWDQLPQERRRRGRRYVGSTARKRFPCQYARDPGLGEAAGRVRCGHGRGHRSPS